MALASRFACLPDDDEADSKGFKLKEKQSKKTESKNAKSKDKSKDKAKNEAKELQNLAFGGGSGKKKNKKKNNPKQQENNNESVEESQNFEEWKERDKALVDDHFSVDMKEAILQSQLDFEQQKSLEAAQKQLVASGVGPQELLSTLSKEDRKKVTKQQKKASTMSLDQFNKSSGDKPLDNEISSGQDAPQLYRHPRHRERAGAGQASNGGTRVSADKDIKPSTNGFFDQINDDVTKALSREKLLETYKNQNVAGDPSLITSYQEKIAFQEQQLLAARLEIEALNGKLAESKLRSKKLTEILLSGEMKEKTEVLVEVHKLEKVREELTSSLSLVSSQLEQEKSLVGNIETEVKRVASAAKPGTDLELCNRIMAIIKAVRK